MVYSSLCYTWTVCLQEPVLQWCVSVYKSFWTAPGRVFLQEGTCTCLSTIALCFTCMCLPTKALFYTWTCLSSRGCAALLRVRLQELCAAPGRAYLQDLCATLGLVCLQSFVLHLDVSVYKSLYCLCGCLCAASGNVYLYAVPVGVRLHFLFVSVCFETGFFFQMF
jgi:hypothetical protein